MYKGEQHGFRKSENIEDALNSELYFFSRVMAALGKNAAEEITPFVIDNLQSRPGLRCERGPCSRSLKRPESRGSQILR